jgi:hypothetical protein
MLDLADGRKLDLLAVTMPASLLTLEALALGSVLERDQAGLTQATGNQGQGFNYDLQAQVLVAIDPLKDPDRTVSIITLERELENRVPADPETGTDLARTRSLRVAGVDAQRIKVALSQAPGGRFNVGPALAGDVDDDVNELAQVVGGAEARIRHPATLGRRPDPG